MTPSTARTVRAAAVIVAVMMGVWAGLRLHAHQAASAVTALDPGAAVRVPAGEASPPTASDFNPSFDAAPPAAHEIPERLPDFSLSDPTGRTTAVSTWAGKSLILNFWATWCAPCRREIPLLQALNTEWSGRGVAVVGVAVDHRDNVVAYARAMKITYALLVGEEDALDLASRFGGDTPVFPFTVFTDRRGEVVALYLGELHKAQADLILSVVQQLNDDRLKLTAARRTIADGLHALATG